MKIRCLFFGHSWLSAGDGYVQCDWCLKDRKINIFVCEQETWELHQELCNCWGDALSGPNACNHCMDDCTL